MLFDELSYLLDCYAPNSGHVFSDVIRICRKKLRETCNGKVIPFDMETLKPKNGYSPDDIKAYKEEINEYNRLKRLYNKLLNKLYEMLEY